MAWYLKAQGIYPLSEMAKAGIKRLLDDIIVDDTPDGEGGVPGATAGVPEDPFGAK
jgi:hypothetical protein